MPFTVRNHGRIAPAVPPPLTPLQPNRATARKVDPTRTVLHSAWTWLTLTLGVVIGFVLMVPLWLCTRPFDPTRRTAGLFFRRVARTIAQLAPMWHFSVRKPHPAELDGAYVVVSNHESHLDAFLISFLPYEMKWLAKDTLFAVPFLGWGMALAGDIKVVRGKGSSIFRAMAQARRLLDMGMPVFIFPEGTRATHEALLPFKDGAFRLALEANVPILPLAVAGTSQGLRKNSLRFYPSRAAVVVGSPISVAPLLGKVRDPADPMTMADAVTLLKEDARMQISGMRAQLRDELGIIKPMPVATV